MPRLRAKYMFGAWWRWEPARCRCGQERHYDPNFKGLFCWYCIGYDGSFVGPCASKMDALMEAR